MDTFPSWMLPCASLRWRPVDNFVTGPESIFGETQRRNPRPGFRWMAEIGEINLRGGQRKLLWEALLINWRMGNELVVVPRCAGPLTPAGAAGGGLIYTPHSDDTPFSDGTLYSQPAITAVLAADVAAGATSAQITLTGNGRLNGAHPFSITGPVYGKRLYGVARILAAPADEEAEGVYTVFFGPNAREAYPAGTAVDLSTPGCVMRPQINDSDRMWPVYGPGFKAKVGVTFIETFNMSDDGDV